MRLLTPARGTTSDTFGGVSGYYPVSMILLYRRLRPLTYFFALVQLALPGALGVVHASSAAGQRGAASHIEETTGRDCPTLHGDDCTICRVLSTGATKSDPAPRLLAEAAHHQQVASEATDPQASWHRGFNSRAPPAPVI